MQLKIEKAQIEQLVRVFGSDHSSAAFFQGLLVTDRSI